VRDALLAEGLAEEHRWVSNSGWITFQMRGEADLAMLCGSCGCHTCGTR
jgi:hypothetical protein